MDYLKNPSQDFKTIFVYGSYEFLAMLEGKIKEASFFKVQSGKITVCLVLAVWLASLLTWLDLERDL